MIKKILYPIIVQPISIYIISLIINGLEVSTLESLIRVSILLSILDITLKPLLKILSFPITIFTLGLSKFIVNGIVFYLAFNLIHGVHIDNVGIAIVSSILLSVISVLIESILK